MAFEPLSRTIVIDSGINSCGDLKGILPVEVTDRMDTFFITDYLVGEAPTAAALRLLATISIPAWRGYISSSAIDWHGLLCWARHGHPRPAASVRVRVEIAASLAGHPHAHVNLLYAVQVLERHHFLAVLDALRIAVEGLAK